MFLAWRGRGFESRATTRYCRSEAPMHSPSPNGEEFCDFIQALAASAREQLAAMNLVASSTGIGALK